MDYEITLKRRDGTLLPVSISSRLSQDETGGIPGFEGILRDISERRGAEERLQHAIAGRDFLSGTLLEFIEFPHESDLYARIAADLKSLVPDAMIEVISYDSASGTLTLRSLKGDTDLEKCTRCLGRNPIGLSLPIDAVALNNLRTSRLIPVPLSLYDLNFRKIPKAICEDITESVNIGDIYVMGFARNGELFGAAAIYLYKGTSIPDIPLIETYIHQASIALQRWTAEEALRTSRGIFSEICEQSPVPISIIDPEGRYLHINRGFSSTFGYTLRDFQTGRGWFLLAFPDPVYRNKVIAAWRSDFETSGTERPDSRTFTVRCKDGTDKEVIFRLITLPDGNRCIIHEDVTLQREFIRTTTLLSAILESTDAAIIGKTIDGTITSWNPAAERMYGYTKDEMIGKHISQIIPPGKRKELYEILEKVRNGETVRDLETSRVRKDGTLVGIVLKVLPVPHADGTVAEASSMAWDISQRM